LYGNYKPLAISDTRHAAVEYEQFFFSKPFGFGKNISEKTKIVTICEDLTFLKLS